VKRSDSIDNNQKTTKRFFARKTPKTLKSSSTLTKTVKKTIQPPHAKSDHTTSVENIKTGDNRITSERTIEKDVTINGVTTTLTITTKCTLPKDKEMPHKPSSLSNDIGHEKQQTTITRSSQEEDIQDIQHQSTSDEIPTDGNPKTFFTPRKSKNIDRLYASKENIPLVKSPLKRKSPVMEKKPIADTGDNGKPKVNPNGAKKKKKRLLSKARLLISQENLIVPPLRNNETQGILLLSQTKKSKHIASTTDIRWVEHSIRRTTFFDSKKKAYVCIRFIS